MSELEDRNKLWGRLEYLSDDQRCQIIDECIAMLGECEKLPGPRIRYHEAVGALVNLKEKGMQDHLKLDQQELVKEKICKGKA